MITREDALRTIRELSLPRYFEQLYTSDKRHPNLLCHFAVPEEFFIITEADQKGYDIGAAVPLWSDQDFYSVVAYSPENKGFIRFDVETGDVSEAVSYQAMIAEELLFLAQFQDSDDDLRELAGLLGFRFAERLLAILAESGISKEAPLTQLRAEIAEQIRADNTL